MRIKKAWFGVLVLAMAFGLIAAAACGSEDATPVIIEKEVIVEKEVIKEVPRDVIVEKEVIVEVEKQVVVEKQVLVEVEKEVIREVEVIKEVEVEKKGPVIGGVPRSGGVLVYGTCADIGGLNPQMNITYSCAPQILSMHEALVERNWSLALPGYKETQFLPGPNGVLAESWDLSDDRVTLTFDLRKGVKFHDGTDWNADVAEMNLLSVIDEDYEFFNAFGAANMAHTMSHVDTARAVDEFTFEIRLVKPFFGFIDKMGSQQCCGMISGKAIQTLTPEEINAGGPFGTAHYKFVSWTRGGPMVMERNEDYWNPDKKAYVDQFVVVPIIDSSARAAALLSGEIDIASNLTPDDFILVAGQPGFKTYLRGIGGFYGLEPNHREPPFNDQRVRHAVSVCFDRRELADDLLKGVFAPGAQIWGSTTEGRDPDGRQITDEYDPELGKQLLAEAGYPDGFKTKMYSAMDGAWGLPDLKINNYIVISLRECGIEVELVNFEWFTYLGYWSGGIPEGENTGLFTMNMGSGDVAGFDQYIHSASWPPAGWSVGWYDNSDVDALVEKAWNATTHEDYLRYEREAHEVALDDYAYIPVLEVFFNFAVSDRVGGWTGSASSLTRFDKAWVEYERE